MKIALIDYGAGNIKSIQFAIERLGQKAVLTHDLDEIQRADKVIFPGVGQASSAMKKLRLTGVDHLLPTLKQPVLGICLGMQLLCTSSEEGNTQGLGVFDVDVVKFESNLKVPQIGWNTISELQGPLFKNIADQEYMYTVHSFYAPCCHYTIAVSEYGKPYSAALAKDNFFGTQFHPEKSSHAGAQVIANFLKL